jgi:hypothetical protein
MKKYTLSYLPIFDADLSEAWHYIAIELKNPVTAGGLMVDTEVAILKRLDAPESFEKHNSRKERQHPYYRIHIRNFTIWYVVINDVMEVRRFLYGKRDAEEFI